MNPWWTKSMQKNQNEKDCPWILTNCWDTWLNTGHYHVINITINLNIITNRTFIRLFYCFCHCNESCPLYELKRSRVDNPALTIVTLGRVVSLHVHQVLLIILITWITTHTITWLIYKILASCDLGGQLNKS